jgi:hypothetical protein
MLESFDLEEILYRSELELEESSINNPAFVLRLVGRVDGVLTRLRERS